MSRRDNRNLKICFTTVQEFKPGLAQQGLRDFIDFAKHQGADEQNIRDLTYNNKTTWTYEDGDSSVFVAVEIVWDGKPTT